MTEQERQNFINEIGPIIKRIGPEYGIIVASPIIAQACLESAYGTSDKAQHHNYFGLKYKPNRVDCNSGTFTSGSQEEENGQMVDITTEWFAFDSMENGVRGYFQFLNSVSNYDNLKGVSDPRTYLENIKADHYATSSTYVDSVMNTLDSNNLTRFDNEEETVMSNSSMVTQTLLSPNCNSPRNQAISKITIHHTAGFATVDQYLRSFTNPDRQASANYIVKDNEVGLCVEECDRAWTSSSSWNDNMAVTIEVGNDGGEETGWHVSDQSLETLIALCIDICKRNGIARLNFTGDKNGNLTMHQYFAATNCPGPYLGSKFPYIVERVNAALGDENYQPPENNSTPAGDKSIDQVAQEVLSGSWGNGDERRSRLEAAGYNYSEVQAKVNKLANGDSTPAPSKSIEEIAQEVLSGSWGNGDERKARLEAAGYNYSDVQSKVNELVNGNSDTVSPTKSIDQVAQEVLSGSWGNGDDRRARLEAAGYNYSEVQARVNELANGTNNSAPSKSIEEVAQAIIRGEYGNGDERRARVEAEGYNYSQVQARVNEIMG